MSKYEVAKEKGYKYDPDTGSIINPYGKKISKKTKNGYIQFAFKIDDKMNYLYGHRFAFYMYHGSTPDIIDHINGNKIDNKIENLRKATKSINNLNKKKSKGVYKLESGKYQSKIRYEYKCISLGTFDTETEARKAYLDYKKKLLNNE